MQKSLSVDCVALLAKVVEHWTVYRRANGSRHTTGVIPHRDT